jgi:hypothetical protein
MYWKSEGGPPSILKGAIWLCSNVYTLHSEGIWFESGQDND